MRGRFAALDYYVKTNTSTSQSLHARQKKTAKLAFLKGRKIKKYLKSQTAPLEPEPRNISGNINDFIVDDKVAWEVLF